MNGLGIIVCGGGGIELRENAEDVLDRDVSTRKCVSLLLRLLWILWILLKG